MTRQTRPAPRNGPRHYNDSPRPAKAFNMQPVTISVWPRAWTSARGVGYCNGWMSDGANQPSKLPFFDTAPAEFDAAVTSWGWPRFRGKQVRDWVYGKLVADPAAMTN